MSLYEKVSRGQRFKPQADDWNWMLEAARKARAGSRTAEESITDFYPLTVARVLNDSGHRLRRFDAVGLGAPLFRPADVTIAGATVKGNLPEFKRQPTFVATTPAAGTDEGKFGVMLEPIDDGKIGACAVAGVVPVLLTGADVGFAEIANAVTTLAASGSGSAKVLWADTYVSSARWAYVRIGGGARTQAKRIRFTLAGALTTATASVSGCTVRSYWEGTNPGTTVTVYNEAAAKTAYMFSGASGNYGLAQWDDVQGKYVIYQMECP